MSREKETVTLKSYNSQYILNINTNSFDKAIENLQRKFGKDKLLSNLTINKINASELDVVEIERIKNYLKEKFNVDYKEKKLRRTTKKSSNNQVSIDMENENLKNDLSSQSKNNKLQEINDVKVNFITDEKVEAKIDIIEKENEYKTKIIKNNLRSGSSINYDGNILVIGDVNPGAELIATGNIIVMGVLRGLASAGAKGDKKVMVIASRILATQLRIAEFIAVPPKNDEKNNFGLQIAIINENKVEIQQIK